MYVIKCPKLSLTRFESLRKEITKEKPYAICSHDWEKNLNVR